MTSKMITAALSLGLADAASADTLYWTQTEGLLINSQVATLRSATLGSTIAAPVGTAAATTLVSGPTLIRGPNGLETDGSRLWRRDQPVNGVYRSGFDGSNAAKAPGASLAYDTVIANGKVYWVNGAGNALESVNENGSRGARQVLHSGPAFPVAVDAIASHLYWTKFNTKLLMRSNLDGSNATLLVEDAAFKKSLDVTSAYIYWTTLACTSSCLPAIVRARLDDSGRERVALGAFGTTFHGAIAMEDPVANLTQVPVPGSAMLLLGGLALLGTKVGRRRR
ncbi:MAG: PEP-CTERM sorting domain-containing protein [bacterium]|jgi:hypothetical protein|nr:DUF5050 domain-containing protein [Betaproteobacteria bacterium]